MQLVKSIVFGARHRESQPAIAFPGGVATYGALIKSTAAAAEALRVFDLPPGSAVMLDIRNPIHHTAMIFALALLGLPSASVGTVFVAEKAGLLPALFLTDRDDVVMAGVRVIRIDERWFAADPAARPDYQALLAMPGFPSPQSVVRYVYSSGTTGHPKCVALTEALLERRLAHGALVTPWWMATRAGLNMLGFSTIAGIMAPLSAHLRGSVLCYAGNHVDALQMLQLFGVAGMALSVGQLQSFLRVLGDHSVPPLSLRFLALLGAKISPALLAETRARLCNTVLFTYGSTEMGSISTALATEAATPEGFAGFVSPRVRLEIVDAARQPVPAGVEGEIRVQTDDLAFYVDAAGQPMEMLDAGWFYPGDIGSLRADGALMITGRSTEVINRGGIVVAPDLIEDVLRGDPRITDVAVVGMVNASGIEEIWAAVVADSLIDPRALIDAVRPQLNEKAPDRIVQINAIPRAESAKVRRGLLREMLRQRV